MTLNTFWLYLGAVVLISSTPGPNIFYVTTRSIRFGFGAAMIAMSGCLLALAAMLTASVAGVSAFMLAVPAAFEALKYAGAAYLIWLGIQAWRAPVVDLTDDCNCVDGRNAEPLRAFSRRLSGGYQQSQAACFCRSFLPSVHSD